ncbi:MAG: dihydroxyacetone kinase subunit DhaK [Deltaproteobacteria bacterium]|mgnify:FL=1|jgi:phosphoenolpyruvate---glycerone phosphotransferase subunit DhaK|nr:dihydroxyacetone kinase subunit DhaK [Deltaproteobacteria bacterium]MBT4643016.1 dihydroxyacetone kinase subunit DhaK [Deltaproteobacteria bacterium]
MSDTKKIINDPKKVVPELLEGLVAASHGSLKIVDGTTAVIRSKLTEGKVGLLTGGGSGHEPLTGGFVGENLADGAVCGNVFASPTPDIIYEAIKAVEKGKGVLNLVLNYAGDNMNFEIACEMAEADGIETRSVQVWDDVLSASKDKTEDRRGIAGMVQALKIVGAAASEISDLNELERIAIKTRDSLCSVGVAVSAGSIPETGEPTFTLAADELEIGLGIHGEPGVERQKLIPADELTDMMVDKLLADLPFQQGDRICLLVNNLGATTTMELLIVNRRIRQILEEKGIVVYDTLLGTYCTSLEMAGFSISFMKLDDELQKYYDMPARSVAFCKG